MKSSRVLEMGDYLVNDFVKEVPRDSKKYSLDLHADPEFNAVRLAKDQVPPADSMWGTYWYRSGGNDSMTRELHGIVNEVTNRVRVADGDIWLDVACNDGTLLKAVPNNMVKIGIDPCEDNFVAESSKVATVVQDFFSKASYDTVANKPAKVITCIAMFYLLDDPVPIVKDLYQVLDDDGILVLQISYTPLMLEQMAFDNICHEHIYYWSLNGVKDLFEQHNFKVVDCDLNDTNGGSMRIYLQKNIGNVASFGSGPLRDVFNFRVKALLEYEKAHYDLRDPALWDQFRQRLDKLREDVVGFIRSERANGKTVWAYGASTKGNTLLQYFGLDENDIVGIAERNPHKVGLRTIGSNIPIYSEADMRTAQPDYLLILPWAFINEFRARESEFFKNGGAFIVPCPTFEIIRG